MSGQVFWEGTTVPRSVHLAKDYSELTKRLYHQWYNAPRGSKPAIRTLSQMEVHPSLKKIVWYDKEALETLRLNLRLGPLPNVEPLARLNSADLAPLHEAYPGQAYFHAHNPAIRRTEKSWFGAGRC